MSSFIYRSFHETMRAISACEWFHVCFIVIKSSIFVQFYLYMFIELLFLFILSNLFQFPTSGISEVICYTFANNHLLSFVNFEFKQKISNDWMYLSRLSSFHLKSHLQFVWWILFAKEKNHFNEIVFNNIFCCY